MGEAKAASGIRQKFGNALIFIWNVLARIFSPITTPLAKVWPSWLTARNAWVRRGIPLLMLPLVSIPYMWYYSKVTYYRVLEELQGADPTQAACAVLPEYMQGWIGQTLSSTAWFPSFITSMDRSKSDWFYQFWGTMDYLLMFALVLAFGFTSYAILKVLEIRARAMALGEKGSQAAAGAAQAAGAGAAASITATLATCWGPLILGFIFGVNLISFSGVTPGVFQFVIPKPYVFLIVAAVVVAGMWWINRQEHVCELLEGERKEKVDISG